MSDELDDVLDLCSDSESYSINLKRKVNLTSLEKSIPKNWEIRATTPVVILIKSPDGAFSVYESGKVLFKDFNKGKSKEYIHIILDLLK